MPSRHLAGVSYPPGSLRPVTPGDPNGPPRPGSDGVDTGRQTILRGKKKEVKLTNDNFITEYPVPARVCGAVEAKWKPSITTKEFSHMRYSAVTCDPDEFTKENGWSLRTEMYNRETELLIAITSYNEDKTLYSRTLHGVMLNISDICKTEQWKNRHVPSWQNITVALIVDGLESMDETVLDILAAVGVYQDGVMKKQVDGEDTVAHLFEYTTQISVDQTLNLILPRRDNLVPVQIILVLKAGNQKKLNSHRWLFNAIGRMLKPEICVLIDAGTKPGQKSIYHLWEAFDNDKNLGGCCGEIHVMINKGRKLLNPLVAAQNFEYKMSNILDKPFESSFGYVSVLPGAFSAYRYEAIGGRPLEQYFSGDDSRAGPVGSRGMNIFTKNMFLAEDRILGFEVVTKAGAKWTLAHVKSSKAETDVPESALELISQRRRWLNGSFAASIYAVVHFGQFYKSNHGIIRKLFFHIQALYNIFSFIFSWFALANIWLTFSIIIDLLPSQGVFFMGNNQLGLVITQWTNLALKWIYLGFLVLQFVLALGNRLKGERTAYVITLWVYAILAVYLLVCSLSLIVKAFANILHERKNKTASQVLSPFFTPPVGALIASVVSTYCIYLFASILYLDPWHMFSSLFQYLCLVPSFTNVLNVYAFCNFHDYSWGTKGSDMAEALPSVSSSKTKAVVQDKVHTQDDLDATYEHVLTRVKTKPDVKKVSEKPSMDDQNKPFRTRLVMFWMFTNAALAFAIEYINGSNPNADVPDLLKRQNKYFTLILYSTLGLAAVRFIGCLWYFFKLWHFRRSYDASQV